MIKNQLLVLLVAGSLLVPKPCLALVHLEPEDLYERSDMVVLGDIVNVSQDQDHTVAQIRVLEAFKGSADKGAILTVQSRGGKVFVEPDEPEFIRLQQNLLFLTKADANTYQCVNQADGQKILRNDHLYPYHDNISFSVNIKDYTKGLKGVPRKKAI